MKKYVFTENQLKKIIDGELEERSRSLANTRKKRLFSKSEIMSNPDRFKEVDKELSENAMTPQDMLSQVPGGISGTAPNGVSGVYTSNTKHIVWHVVDPNDGKLKYYQYPLGGGEVTSTGTWSVANGTTNYVRDGGTTTQLTGNWIIDFQQQLKDAGYGSQLGTSGPNNDGVDGKLGGKTATAAYSLLKAKGIIN